MSDVYQQYWNEAIECAFEECGIEATQEQIDQVAGFVQSSHENYGMSFGYDVASANFAADERNKMEKLRKSLEDERNRRPCHSCNGTGYYKGYDFERNKHDRCVTECYDCKGLGRI